MSFFVIIDSIPKIVGIAPPSLFSQYKLIKEKKEPTELSPDYIRKEKDKKLLKLST